MGGVSGRNRQGSLAGFGQQVGRHTECEHQDTIKKGISGFRNALAIDG
jgi:hypothetical protein